MNLPARKRWAAFALIVLPVSAIVAWVARDTWKFYRQVGAQMEGLREISSNVAADAKTLRDMEEQYSRIAMKLPQEIQTLNSNLLAFALHNGSNDVAQFERKAGELESWLAGQKAAANQVKLMIMDPVPFTVSVRELVDHINVAFETYRTDAKRVTEMVGASADVDARLRLLEKVYRDTGEVLALSAQAQAQAEAIRLSSFVAGTWFPRVQTAMSGWIDQVFHRWIYVTYVAVVALVAVIGVAVYLLLVAPLRTKLVESDAVIEGQKKLTHFGELAAGLVHDVRSPLRAISYGIFTLQKVFAEGSAEHHDAEVIRAAINSLDQIVKEFFERGEPATPKLVPVTAQTVFKEIHELLSPELEGDSIELKIEPSTDPLFRADAQQLRQVLINLVGNAAEAIGQKGTITLRARLSDRQLKGRQTDVVILEVQDTGPGISEEVRPKLFDPFFSTKKRGTGLGLAIAARIADNHGGKLEFDSELGVGTTFRLVLPASGDV
jgi:signal transduction histidine kinase